jgi:glycosyltransferase involved in cell wall biosynthesis
MRVCLVTSVERGGPLEHAILLARGLVGRGAEVAAVCASTEAARRFAQAGANVHVLPLRRSLDPFQALRIARVAGRADVVHAHDRRSGLWTRVVPGSRRTVRVYTAHGLPDAFLPPHAGRPPRTLRDTVAYRCLDATLAYRAHAVVAPSRAAADLLVGQLGYPAERITVIANGVEPAPAPPGRNGGGEPLVGTLSVLEPIKGLDVFLLASARVAQRHAAVRFAVFGTGTQHGELRRLAADLGLGSRILMPGHVSAPDALGQLAVFVSSSHFETSGIALLQAMAAGVPAVATAVGGVPENAPPDTVSLVPAGEVTDMAAAIARLIERPDLGRRQASAARAHVARWRTATRTVDATVELYERLLGGRAA